MKRGAGAPAGCNIHRRIGERSTNRVKLVEPDGKWVAQEKLGNRIDCGPALTFREELKWLEEAEALSLRFRASREQSKDKMPSMRRHQRLDVGDW